MKTAFTIVELLVVVTIMVVLLSLLTPAIDRAIYQVEMAMCMSNLHGIAQGGLSYTGDFKQRYPYRAHVQPGSYGAINMNNGTGPNLDDRVIFRGYITVNKLLNCPLNKKLDYEGSSKGPGAVNQNTLCYSDYAMWMGWRVGGEKGMSRLGDRFTWNDVFTGEKRSSNALASSFAQIWEITDAPAYGDHPDNNGQWRQWAEENAGDYWNATPLYTITWSTYMPDGYPYDFNMNFALDDNSVRRIDNITPDTREVDGVLWTRSWTDPQYANRTPLPAN